MKVASTKVFTLKLLPNELEALGKLIDRCDDEADVFDLSLNERQFIQSFKKIFDEETQ